MPTLLSKPQVSHEYLFWSYETKRAVRMSNWKAVLPGNRKNLELYDLAVDIGETTDLSSRQPDIVAKMRAIIETAYVPK